MNVSVLGLGPMGLRHARAVLQSEHVHLLGGCDRRPETAEALAAIDPDAAFHDTLDGMLAAGPDIVVIATNADSHADLFETCVRAGVRRFVIEKPVCVSLAQARRMRQLADESGSRVVVNISRRYADLYETVRTRHADAIGGIRAFHATLGASGLGCNGTHLLDLGLLLLGGEPATVSAWLDDGSLPNPRGPQFSDPGGVGMVRWADGRRIVLDMGDDLGVQGKYQCFGPWGRIVIDEIRRELDVQARDEQGRDAALSRVGTPLHDADAAFEPALDVVDMARRAIEDAASDDAITCGLDEATAALALVIGFHLSSEAGGTPIAFDDIELRAGDRAWTFT